MLNVDRVDSTCLARRWDSEMYLISTKKTAAGNYLEVRPSCGHGLFCDAESRRSHSLSGGGKKLHVRNCGDRVKLS